MGKKEILKEKNYKPPMWCTITIWVLTVRNIIAESDHIFVWIIVAFGSLIAADIAYSLARRIDRKGTIGLWLCILFNFIGLFVYWIYYKTQVNKFLK